MGTGALRGGFAACAARFPGENPDWDGYRARMERVRRVLLRLTIERAGPDVQG